MPPAQSLLLLAVRLQETRQLEADLARDINVHPGVPPPRRLPSASCVTHSVALSTLQLGLLRRTWISMKRRAKVIR